MSAIIEHVSEILNCYVFPPMQWFQKKKLDLTTVNIFNIIEAILRYLHQNDTGPTFSRLKFVFLYKLSSFQKVHRNFKTIV